MVAMRSSSKPNSVRTTSYSPSRSGPNSSGSSALSEHSTPASSSAGQRVLGVAREHREHDVRGRAHVEADAQLGEPLDQAGHLGAAHAVPDAHRAEQVDRVGHELAALELAGVGRDQQAALAGDAERLDEVLRRVADLVVVEAEAHDVGPVLAQGEAGQSHGVVVAGSRTRSTGTIQRMSMPCRSAAASKTSQDQLPAGLVGLEEVAVVAGPEGGLDVDGALGHVGRRTARRPGAPSPPARAARRWRPT